MALLLSLLAACGPLEPAPAPTATPPAAEVEVFVDVPYAVPLRAGVEEQWLDIYAPVAPGDWPLVVFAHGYDDDKRNYARLCRALAGEGALVFAVNWPVWIPELAAEEDGRGFREMAEALACAVRFARAAAPDYGGDPARVVLVGFSNGGGAAAFNALVGDGVERLWEDFAAVRGGPPPQVTCVADGVSARVDGLVGVSGAYDAPTGTLQVEDPALWAFNSTYAHLGENPELRVRLLHSEGDEVVPFELALQFEAALIGAGYDAALTSFDGVHEVPVQLTIETVMELVRE
jgi:predicted esterase